VIVHDGLSGAQPVSRSSASSITRTPRRLARGSTSTAPHIPFSCRRRA
jgi:hypothetical protein